MLINGQDYKINKTNAVINQWDEIYCHLLKKIISEGLVVNNRIGISNFNFTLENIDKYLPLLESRKVIVKNALSEILWIYQVQSNKVKWLHKRYNHIWDELVIDKDGIYRTYEINGEYDPEKQVPVMDLEGRICLNNHGREMMTGSTKEGKTIKSAKFYGKELAGTIGTMNGWINNKYKGPQYVLKELKENPNNKELKIVLSKEEYLKTGVVEPCISKSEYKVLDGKLHASIYQESVDVASVLPFNVIQYALLISMFAKVSNLEVGNISYNIKDAHIYKNQLDGIKLQLDRFYRMEHIEKIIRVLSEKDLNDYYGMLISRKKLLLERIKNSINLLENEDELREIEEEILILELMVTKERPVLELAEKNDFFKFSNEVINDREYLKKNATGNRDIKIKKYTSAPYIKM